MNRRYRIFSTILIVNSAKKFGQIWLCLTALSVPINKLYERNVM
ncbi:hypothetical protein ACO2JH_01095 [Leptospira interrogans]|nr:hypothetical protein [Leptospira interrogans]EKO71797.1 hypothetical protein LEP1GSC069_3216 [Leptospira interrogans serovar Canicola str. Fiocruz LV133]EMK16404.1 hypothetical protein LEP1GSC075_2297 [Leptospira interrogans str. Kito]EMN75306.1 hypothetical protein LEP1GSC102_4157 [Leptospira interrogans str. UI 09600]